MSQAGKTYHAAYRAKHKKKINAHARKYAATPERLAIVRKSLLHKNYGITPQEYDEMLNLQHGVCAGCGRPPKTRRLSVDHKHQKKEKHRTPAERRAMVRGLLCFFCNKFLGMIRDNQETLRRLDRYLSEWPAKRVLNHDSFA